MPLTEKTVQARKHIARKTIRAELIKQGYKLKDIAEKTLLIRQSELSKRFSGEREFSIDELLILSDKIGISLDQLYNTQHTDMLTEYDKLNKLLKQLPVEFVPALTSMLEITIQKDDSIKK